MATKKMTSPTTLQTDINRRFNEAVIQIVARNQSSSGQYASRLAVAKSIGIDHSNMPNLSVKRPRNAMLEGCARLCQVHGINPSWLLLGDGEMFVTDDISAKERMREIELRLLNLEKKTQ